MTSFRVLGPVEVWAGERRLVLGGPRQLALLALLLLRANRAVSSDALIDALWGPERAGAGKRLQVAIARLRRALQPLDREGEPLLRTVGGGYLLSLPLDQLDAEVFGQRVRDGQAALDAGDPARASGLLSEALELWRGPALAEVAFEDFAQAEVRRLEELRLVALEARIDADLRLGRHAQLVGELEALLAEQSTRESVARQLMLALYRCERQGDALEVYQRTRAQLAEQLGLEPGPALKVLQAQILDQAPALQAGVASDRAKLVIAGVRVGFDTPPGARLPLPPTPTVGREHELEGVSLMLASPSVRLVTLTGPGGVGKTRLALEVAQAVKSSFPHGVCWVELSGVRRPNDVASTIARALAVEALHGERTDDALRRYLANRQLLLVIDNFEHVLDAAELVGELLGAGDGLKVLVTSREALDLGAEHRVTVQPLTVPAGSDAVSVAEIKSTDATALFLAAARRRDERFEVTPENAPVIAQICTRLEGLPLALELAAARAGALGVGELAARLGPVLDQLGAGRRDAPARQRTLRATIEWSHRLLTDDEARAFVQFAVFAGGATLDAAEAVTGAAAQTFEALVAKSLIDRRLQAGGSSRFVMLDTIREYALELLSHHSDQERLRERHAHWFLEFAKQVEQHLRSREQAAWYSRLRDETDNLRAVLEWFLENDIGAGVELVPAIFRVWRLQGQLHKLIAWLEGALASPTMTDPRTRAIGLREYGHALDEVGEYERSRQALQKSLKLFRELGDRTNEADVLLGLSMVARDQGSSDDAIALAEPALAIFRELGDQWWVAQSLHLIGEYFRDNEEFERSSAALEESLASFNDLGDRSLISRTTHSYGDLALDQGDAERARGLYRRALTAAIEIGDLPGLYYCTAGLACIAGLSPRYLITEGVGGVM